MVLGDVHGENPINRDALLDLLSNVEYDFALQVGDLGWYADLPRPLYFIPGNNEDFDLLPEVARGKYRNLHLIESGEAIEKSGLRIAGLRGNYAPTQYEKPRGDLRGDRRRHFTREDVEATLRLDSVDVLLSHEAPHGLVFRGYDAGNKYVDLLVRGLSPRYHFAGHHHEYRHQRLDGTRAYVLAPANQEYLVLEPEEGRVERHTTHGWPL